MHCLKSCFAVFILFPFIVNADDAFYQRKYNVIEKEQLFVSVNYFEELVEQALVMRAKTLLLAMEFQQLQKQKQVLSGKLIERIQLGIKSQQELRNSLYRMLFAYRSYGVPAKGEEGLLDINNRLKGSLIAMANVTLLYDNYVLAMAAIYRNDDLRRLMNRGNKGFDIKEDQLDEVVKSFHDPKKRKEMRGALEWLKGHSETLDALKKEDSQVSYLCQLIESSPSVKDIRQGGEFGDYFRKIKLLKNRSGDSLVNAGESTMNSLSKLFGNSVGLIQVGNGKLYKDKRVAADVKGKLKPLDVLLEKTPFRLTDKFIPGHYGHVAIWVGTEQELRKLNMWEHPLIKAHQKDIRAGKCVLEALRDGVQLNTLEHFLDVDDVAVLRPRQYELKQVLPRAFRQLGKEYDFNFDVETIDKIVCSELVYQVFTEIDWPTERTLGRYTISPDNVALKALQGGPFRLIHMYHDGVKVEGTIEDKYKNLLKK